MMGQYGFGGGGLGFLWPLLQLVIVIGVIYFVVQLFQKKNGENHSNGNHSNENAMEILDKRYAQGEISDDEYEKRKRTLTSKVR